MAKKHGKSKSTNGKKNKSKKLKVIHNSDEEKETMEPGSSSDESGKSNDNEKNIHEDTQMLDFDDTRYNITYITIKMTLDTNANAIEALHDKYTSLKTIMLEADNSVIFLPINPAKTADPLRQKDKIPSKMTGISTYFHSTSRLPKSDKASYMPIIWANARIVYDSD